MKSDSPVTLSGVIVAHPGTQHSYQTALALQEAGLLDSYLTGIYYKPKGSLARLVENLPGGLRTKFQRELRRRHLTSLDPGHVQTHALAELLFVGCSRFKPLRKYTENILVWRNERFDRWTADILRMRRRAAIVCYNTCAMRTFAEAKLIGAFCILDQTIADYRAGIRLLREETDAQPDFADSIDITFMESFGQRSAAEPDAADLILAGSDYVKWSLQENGVEAGKIAVVPYGADPERFTPGPKARDGVFRILFVGQISQRKGIKYLLEAVKQLRLPQSELTIVGGIVGSGAGLAPYREYFRWVPNVPNHEVHRFFQTADIFVYPSLFEGSAIATYEALASGLPVITTPNSGSVVCDGVEGFLVPIRDVEKLKEKILLLYRDLELRETMSLAARKRAMQFTWTAYRQRVEALLRGVVESPSIRAAD